MFDFLVNDKLKTICLTYPKGASTSIRTILMPRFEDSELGINVNEFGEKWILDDQIPDSEVHSHLAKYPDYKIYAFCREPVERWVTGLLFIMHTHWDLFYSDVSNAGQQISDNASNEYIKQLVLTMVSINNQRCDFNDVHMHRALFTLLQIKLIRGDFAHLMPLSSIDGVLCDIHNAPRQTFAKENTSVDGYERGHGHHDNSKFIPKLHSRWKEVIINAVREQEDFSAVDDYLSIENKVYKQQVQSGQDAGDIFNQILDGTSCSRATGLFCDDMTSYADFINHLDKSPLRDKAIANSFYFTKQDH